MSKVFEYILAKPAEFFSLLAICIAVTYTTIRILKGFFGLFTRKRKRRKEQEKMHRQAELVIEKLGGVEEFSNVVAEKVISKQSATIEELKENLKALATMDKCPIELKAYLETVLKTNPTLALQYEECKTKLVTRQQSNTVTKVEEQVKQALPVEQQEQIKKQKEEISYV